MSLKVGESRQEGVVMVSKVEEEKIVVECGMCRFRYETAIQSAADWVTFTHNKNFKKRGCDAEVSS